MVREISKHEREAGQGGQGQVWRKGAHGEVLPRGHEALRLIEHPHTRSRKPSPRDGPIYPRTPLEHQYPHRSGQELAGPTPRTVANVVLGLNPDVVVLQEAGRDQGIYREVYWQVHCDRVLSLAKIIREAGFNICSSKCSYNTFMGKAFIASIRYSCAF